MITTKLFLIYCTLLLTGDSAPPSPKPTKKRPRSSENENATLQVIPVEIQKCSVAERHTQCAVLNSDKGVYVCNLYL